MAERAHGWNAPMTEKREQRPACSGVGLLYHVILRETGVWKQLVRIQDICILNTGYYGIEENAIGPQ